jgi:Flp pilus assembly protein TadD
MRPSSTRAQQLAHAQALLHQGRLAEAANTLRELLAVEPRSSDALHLLGTKLLRW